MVKLFITGTGTDVGKTFVTTGLAAMAADAGKRVAVLKPVQTGLSEYSSDLSVIRKLAPDILDIPEKRASAYVFDLPASPHLAAAEEGKRVAASDILKFIENIENEYSPDILLVEGAGGVLVPLNENETFIDLMRLSNIPVMVVALAGLGTINHTLLTLEALKRRNVGVVGVVLNRYPDPPGIVERDNIATIERFSGINVLASIKEFNDPLSIPTARPELLAEFSSYPRLGEILRIPEF